MKKKYFLIGILILGICFYGNPIVAKTLPEALGVWGVEDDPVVLYSPQLRHSEGETGVSKEDALAAPIFGDNVKMYYYLDHAPVDMQMWKLGWTFMKKIAKYRWTTLELFIPSQQVPILIKPINNMYEIVPANKLTTGTYMFCYRDICYLFNINKVVIDNQHSKILNRIGPP